jgi:hypothetical protein
MQLLLACCRSSARRDELEEKALLVGEWPDLVRLARHHLILPLVYFHLRSLADNAIPDSTLANLAQANRKAVTTNLLQQAELAHLVKNHLTPRGIRHVTVKGLSLAGRYYPDMALRQARDIDLLVEPSHLHELTSDLLDHGYKLITSRKVDGDADLRIYCALNGEVTMASPRGVPVQLHQLLDFNGCQFPVQAAELIGEAETITLNGRDFPVLPTTDLFVYIAHHHGRHQWSRLHWLADLDAIMSHPTFDAEQVSSRASALGMTPVVEAALSLHEVLFSAASPHRATSRFSRRISADCLHYLQESTPPPEQIREEQRKSGIGIVHTWLRTFSYNWHCNTHWRNRLRYLFSISKATYADYLFLRLPPGLHGLYRPIRPIRWCVEIIRGRPTGSG